MSDMRHFRVVRRVRKAAEVINHTDRADRVPNADKVDGARPCESSLKLSAGFSTWTLRPKIALPVIEGIRQETLRMRVKQADRMEESNSWRNPIDLIPILESAFQRIPSDSSDQSNESDARALAAYLASLK